MPLTNSGAQVCLDGPGLAAVTRYIGLFVGNPNGSGVEVSASGYARLTRTAGQMPVANNVVTINAGEWSASTEASWGTPDYIGVFTTAGGGTLLAYEEISPALAGILMGARVFSNTGDITVTIPLA